MNTIPHHGDISRDEFRRTAHQLVDWIADHFERIESDAASVPVLPDVQPDAIAAMLPTAAPAAAEPMASVLADIDRVILRGMTHWNHPNFFAYFANSGSFPGILAELLCAALNNNAMLWKTGPSATELETVTLGWLRDILGLPAAFDGMIYDTASVSTMTAIAAAREQALAHARADVKTKGLFGSPVLRVYASEFVHSSIDKSCLALGIGLENVVKIPVNERFEMNVEALQAAIRADRERGYLPICVVPVVGTTSCASADPIAAVADVCERESAITPLWMHVDAAYAGPTAMLDECRPYFAGWERADSIVINPHKWLFVPMDLSVLYTRKLNVVKDAFSLVPEYLKTKEGAGNLVQNQMDYGVQLGRRFRSLKLWFVMRAFGVDGLKARLREHNALAAMFAGLVEASPNFELTAPVRFSLVCFRYKPAGVNDEAALEKLNAELLERVNATRELFISHTKLGNAPDALYTLRFAVGNLQTAEQHVRRAFEVIAGATAGLTL